MRANIFFLLFNFIVFNGSAQQKMLDSIELKLNQHPAGDTTRLKLLSNVAYYYNEVDPEKGMKYAEEQLSLAKAINMPKHEADALANRGINYWAQGEYEKAIEEYKGAQEIYKQLHLEKEYTSILGRIGVVYFSSSDYPKALDVYWESLKAFEKRGEKQQVSRILGNIALCYSNMDKTDKAITFYKKAIALNIELKDEKGLADNYTNIGNLYDNMLESDTAISYYQKALAISRTIGYERNIASNTCNMGIALTSKKNYAEAYDYLQQGMLFYKKQGNKRALAVIYKSIADIFMQAPTSFFPGKNLDASKRNSYSKNYLDSSFNLYESMQEPSGQAEVWKMRSSLDSAQNNFRQAFESYKQYSVLRDSLFNDEKHQEVATLEMSYAFSKKEDSIRSENEQMALAASAEIKRQSTIKKTTIVGSTILFVAALASFIFYKRKRDAVEKQQEAEFKTEVTDTEMKALRAQMNPHFIFNSLNSISDYISKNNIPEADRYLSKFAKLMRLILENSEQKEIPLQDDLKALELYMQLEALRMKNKFSHSIEVDKTIDPSTTLVPPLILQPFVENSIWHGIAGKEGNGHINIIIKKDENEMINCIVEDDGVGRKQTAATTSAKEKSSLGMKITQQRIDVLNKIKNTKAAVQLFDKEHGLRVEVKLPFITT
ncbi:MAG: tetratricopeptide repeat protein [Ferruginibacter sp.]